MSVVIIKQNPHTYKNPFMGMENHNMTMWDGTTVFMDVPMQGDKYIHGLKKEEIEEVGEKLGVDFSSTSGQDFLRDFTVRIPATIQALDLSRPEDLLTLRILESMGNFLAPSKGEASSAMQNYSFYAHNKEEEAREKNKTTRTVNTAVSKIETLSIENPEFFLAVCKYVLPENSGIGTSVDAAYELINDYVKGSLVGAEHFLVTINEEKTSKHKIYVTNDIKTALLKNIIRRNNKGYYYNPLTNTEYGKNLDEISVFLMDPKNLDELGSGDKDDATYSIKYQLKNK